MSGQPHWLSRRQTLVAGLVTLAAIGVPAWMLVHKGSGGDLKPEDLLDLGPAPDFELVDQTGAPLSSASLRGHIVVVNFIFTSCTSACPLLTERMATVARVLNPTRAPELRFLSISIDPERDTPAALTAFANAHGAIDRRWSFVTGDPATITAVIAGYKMAAQKQAATPDGHYDIVHSERFALVDERGALRGFYRTDQDGLRDVTNQAWLLYKSQPR